MTKIENMADYQRLAARTIPTIQDKEPQIDRAKYSMDILHAVLGINSEVGEFMPFVESIPATAENRKEFEEEIGDLLWYVAYFTTILGWNLREFEAASSDAKNQKRIFRVGVKGTVLEISEQASDLADAIKKYIFYGKDFDFQKVRKALERLFILAKDLSCYSEKTLCEIAADNIEKLLDRYPSKFTEQDAIERKDKQ